MNPDDFRLYQSLDATRRVQINPEGLHGDDVISVCADGLLVRRPPAPDQDGKEPTKA